MTTDIHQKYVTGTIFKPSNNGTTLPKSKSRNKLPYTTLAYDTLRPGSLARFHSLKSMQGLV
jgi:hypothetical protein